MVKNLKQKSKPGIGSERFRRRHKPDEEPT